MYGARHCYDGDAPQRFWQAVRRPDLTAPDGRTEVFLRLADIGACAAPPGAGLLRLELTCSHGDQAALQRIGRWRQVGGRRTASVLHGPTPPLRPMSGDAAGPEVERRMAGPLALSGLAARDPRAGADALRCLLYDRGLPDWRAAARLRDADAARRRAFERLNAAIRGATVTGAGGGRRVELELAADAFPGGSPFLFGAVLDRFFGSLTPVNSFTQLTVITEGGRRQWLPRSGEEVLG